MSKLSVAFLGPCILGAMAIIAVGQDGEDRKLKPPLPTSKFAMPRQVPSPTSLPLVEAYASW